MTQSNITVLHVDDDEAFTELVREHVQHHYDDISVHTVHDGSDALARLEAVDDIDCVVSDHEMPGETGLELLAAVRNRWPDMPFILFTGKGSEEIAESAITAGVTDYLQKRAGTSQYAVLVNRIRNAVAHYHAETELRRVSKHTQDQFELLVDTVEDYGIFLLDPDGCVRTWNQGAEKLTGYTASEIDGEHVSVFYRETDVERGIPEQQLREAASQGQISNGGWRVRKDGSKFRADVTITALHEDGELVGYVRITRDNTRRHREQVLLEQNQQLKGHIAALSHDLRSPLSVVRGNVELAVDTGDLSCLDRAMKGLDRLEELLDYITTLAEEGRTIMEPEPVDFHQVVEAAWDAVETDGAELLVDENSSLVVDGSRLQQLLENLFKNAVSHGGPNVTVRAGRLDDGGFYVEDDGQGIPAAERGEVFEMGYSTDPDGTGVGLAICKQIADAHGWIIDATEGSDGGASFEISGVEGVEGRQ